MSELSDIVSDEPKAVPGAAWRSDPAAVMLRVLIIVLAIFGVNTTLRGLRDAWSHGASVSGDWGAIAQQMWGVTPYVLLVLISMFRISKRSLSTLLITTLLAWFMSTGYWHLDEMGLMVLVIPFIQLVFIMGAMGVMFTFWLLRKRKN
jgi:hypothetical protein